MNPTNINRRYAIKLLVGFGTFGVLSGCCSLIGKPRSRITSSITDQALISSVFKPTRINRSIDKKSKFALDAHAHFFNASDVNVKDYLELCIAHDFENEELGEFLSHLGGVAEVLAKTLAPSAKSEYDYLVGILGLEKAIINFKLDEKIFQQRYDFAEKIVEEFSKRGLDKSFLKILNKHERSRGRQITDNFDKDFVLKSITSTEDYYDLEHDSNPLDSDDPRGILEFLFHMLSPRWMNLKAYIKGYSESDYAFGIDGVFASLVDFDYWLGCFPKSSRRDQMLLHSLLSSMSGGFMLPLISYNPWTDIKSGSDESLSLVKEAINDYGFVGVKIYPPVGFLPYGNCKNKEQLLKMKPPMPEDLCLLDKKLEALFKYCAENAIPVMAHSGESMGRDNASDILGGPDGWRNLFDKFKTNKYPSLVINAGHFGGDHNKDIGGNWTNEFASLANDFPENKLYGDLGFWDSYAQCNKKCIASTRLLNTIKTYPEMQNRVMFGTDWLMLSRVRNWQLYPSEIAKKNHQHLEDNLPDDKFFYKNIMDCFGLSGNGSQRKKIVDRLSKLPTGVPDWITESKA